LRSRKVRPIDWLGKSYDFHFVLIVYILAAILDSIRVNRIVFSHWVAGIIIVSSAQKNGGALMVNSGLQ
jgi:hypothetical protein